MSDRYQKSEKMLTRALESIPLGTQTFSKSKTQYPYGVSPYFITRGQGSHVWDVDGNEYIDFVNALGAIILGYNDPDVNEAVCSQLANGVIFSLPHPLELKVAEKIIKMVPCAEMVRFGKNGSDATAGAIRLARAFNGREHVAVCGYHGWQDWYIGSTARNLGVPETTRNLTCSFEYNDLGSLEKLFNERPGKISAVIMEPMVAVEPKKKFLNDVKEVAHNNGALFILDETITGFRFAPGGAHEYFNIMPDLAAFGKGMSNGFPLSVVAGRADIMSLMEEIFFSFTFGGETLSLAAAMATLNKIESEPVIETLKEKGTKIIDGVRELIKSYGMEKVIAVSGNPVLSFIQFFDTNEYSEWEVKTLFQQEMFKRGILILASHNMSYSHSNEDVKMLLEAYNEVLGIIKDAVENNVLDKYLNCIPLKPLFKIR